MLLKLRSKSLVRHAASWGLGSVSETLAKILIVFIAIAFFSKEEFGYISSGMLFFSYLTLAQLGFSDALMLRLPELQVKEKHQEFLKYTSTVLYLSTANILAVGFCGLIYMVFNNNDWLMIITICCFYVSGLIYNFYYHYLLFYKFKYKLSITALARGATSFLRIGPQLAVLYYFGLIGYLIFESILFVVPILIMMNARSARLTPFIDRNIVVELLKDAKFLFLLALFGLLSNSSDRWVLMISGNMESMATYNFPVFIATAILFIPSQVLSIFSQYAREMLAKQIPVAEVFDAYVGWVLVVTVVLGSLSIFIVEFSMPLIKNFLPDYNDSIILVPAVLLGVFFKASLAGFLSFLVINKNYKALFLTNVVISLLFLGGIALACLGGVMNLFTIACLAVVSVVGGIATAIISASLCYKISFNSPFFVWIAISLLNIVVCIYGYINDNHHDFDFIKSVILIFCATVIAAVTLFSFIYSRGSASFMRVVNKDF